MTTAKNTQVSKKLSGLQLALRSNAIFSLIAGLIFIFDSKWLTPWMGLENNLILIVIGIALLPWAYLLFNASKQEISKKFAQWIIAGDLIWVILSVEVILGIFVKLTVPGNWFVAAQADIVLGFAVWQFFALRKQIK